MNFTLQKLRIINLFNVIPSFILFQNPREWMFSFYFSLLVTTNFPSHISWAWHQNEPPKNSKPDVHMHHIVIIIIIHYDYNVDFVLFHNVTCYIFSYHASMLLLQNSMISRVHWLPQAWNHRVYNVMTSILLVSKLHMKKTLIFVHECFGNGSFGLSLYNFG